MIPILYESTETAFTSNGMGRLTDCASCLVTEERNGIYEVEFTYPITGIHYAEIIEGRIILVDHDEQKDAQPFVIYHRSAPISGLVTFHAHHISYRLSNVIVKPFSASSVNAAFLKFQSERMTTNPFTFWTDNSTIGTVNFRTPGSVRSELGGVEGSILDVFGGEYEYDKFLVRNYAHRGSNNGVVIRYGKNLSDLNWEVDTSELYSKVVPFWTNSEENIYGDIVGVNLYEYWTEENGTRITDENSVPIYLHNVAEKVTVLDLSTEFETKPTKAQLESRARSFLTANTPWIPQENLRIDFVPLWQTDEYADIAPLERVQLCDTVKVIYTALGVSTTLKVIRVVWDALLERYDKIELGSARSSFADTIISRADKSIAKAIETVPTTSFLEQSIDEATSRITGGQGGYISYLFDANGKPTDLLFMDSADPATAVNVMRINVNGIGFSNNGVNGTYRSAWTLDSKFVADFITAGTLSADRINGGTLALGGANGANGVLCVYSANGNRIIQQDQRGMILSFNYTDPSEAAAVGGDEAWLDGYGVTVYDAVYGFNSGAPKFTWEKLATICDIYNHTFFDFVSRTGDTMTGTLTLSGANHNATSTNITSNTAVSSDTWGNAAYILRDRSGNEIGRVAMLFAADGTQRVYLRALRSVNGSNVVNTLSLGISANGTRTVGVSDATVWRNALGASAGVWPVSAGGTGKTYGYAWQSLGSVTNKTALTIDLTNYSEICVVARHGTDYQGSVVIPKGQLSATEREWYLSGGAGSTTANRRAACKLTSTKMTPVIVTVDSSDVTSGSTWWVYAR